MAVVSKERTPIGIVAEFVYDCFVSRAGFNANIAQRAANHPRADLQAVFLTHS